MGTQTIGIWGYGKTGKSLATFLTDKNKQLFIMDKDDTVEQKIKKDFPTALFFKEENYAAFFEQSSLVIPSSGVDITNYYHLIKDKLTTEADIFFATWQKPIIAVTGSVGKTTTVTFLSKLFELYEHPVATGGNIGKPMLELLSEKKDCALLELSSFQLEHSKIFLPTLAVWTNFYPNHLDRHQKEATYFKAKYQLLNRQTKKETAIVPVSLIPFFDQYGWPQAKLIFTGDVQAVPSSFVYPLFSVIEKNICLKVGAVITPLVKLSSLPPSTIQSNWLTIVAILHVMNILDERFVIFAHQLTPVSHRTELVTTINTVTFVNDSKSTTIASTKAAIEKYKNAPIVLIVGGLSKGVDRLPLIEYCKNKVHSIITFGSESEYLRGMCTLMGITSYPCSSLEEAVKKAYAVTPSHSTILFSPAGSSYDQFKDYEERGNAFKEIVAKL